MPTDIITLLRVAIEKSGRTHYDLGKSSGVPIAAIDRFMSGERGITLATAAKLAEELNLTLVPLPRKKS